MMHKNIILIIVNIKNILTYSTDGQLSISMICMLADNKIYINYICWLSIGVRVFYKYLFMYLSQIKDISAIGYKPLDK